MKKKNSTKIENIISNKYLQRGSTLAIAAVVALAVGYVGIQSNKDSHAATGGTMTVMNPAAGPYAAGSTFSVAVRENSGTNPVNAVQTVMSYNPGHIQFVSLTEGTAFPNIAATDTATAGSIKLARGTAGGTTVTGDKLVATVTFKVLKGGVSTGINIDQSQSLLMYAADNTNMLSSVQGATVKLGAKLALSPATGSYASGAVIPVALRVDSGSEVVNVVQTAITYDATKLQFDSISEGTVFTTVAATDTATAGVIKLARGTPVGAVVSGGQTVLTVNFKALAASGTVTVSQDPAYGLVMRSSDNVNILAAAEQAMYTFNSNGPAVSGVSPLIGKISGGTPVTISGANFVSGATVKFGSSAATSVDFKSSTSLTAVAPAGALGPVVISVTNPDGRSTQFNGFKYVPNPGDANNDGRVNVLDLSVVISKDGQGHDPADFNGDGTIGAADLSIVLGNWTW